MKPKTKHLPNGLRMLLVPMEDQRTATVLVLVEAGSKYESRDIGGLSHFLEHMCFKGTTRRPDQATVAKELDGMGADYNAFTGHEYTGYFAKVAARHLPQALDLISDIYCDPLFKEEDIKRERGAIEGEIDMRSDMLPGKAGELFMELLYGDQPAGRPIAGTKELVRGFTREQFLSYRSLHYVPRATIVVVAGKFSPKDAEEMVRERFGHLRPGRKQDKLAVSDRQREPGVLVRYKESDQTHLVLGFRGVPLGHPDHHALAVLAAVLGGGMSSRLFQRVRTEMGLGYYVRAAHDAFTDHGILAASAGVDNRRVDEAVTAILEEFTRLASWEVSKDELAKTKDMIAGRLVLGLETSDELGEYYGFQEILKRTIETPEEVMKKIERVTSKDILAAAGRVMTAKRLNLALLGPWKDGERFKKLLKI